MYTRIIKRDIKLYSISQMAFYQNKRAYIIFTLEMTPLSSFLKILSYNPRTRRDMSVIQIVLKTNRTGFHFLQY